MVDNDRLVVREGFRGESRGCQRREDRSLGGGSTRSGTVGETGVEDRGRVTNGSRVSSTRVTEVVSTVGRKDHRTTRVWKVSTGEKSRGLSRDRRRK